MKANLTHPLALSRSPRVPRSLDALTARTEAPTTDQTPVLDAVLLSTTVSAVRAMQIELETMRGQMAAMRQTIKDLSYMLAP